MVKLKKVYVILILILLFSFYLRVYHADYPVVGYHNWKETHYLTEARNFATDGFFENGFFIPEYDYPKPTEDPSGAHSDTFPLLPIVLALFFNLFGTSLFTARIVTILFSLGSIVFMYFLIKFLFKREDLALTSAAILAFLPLHIVFGKQVQLINPALFFALGGLYFYFKWLKNYSWKNTILFSVFIILSILTKYTFALFLFPMIFVFPFKKILDKTLWKKYLLIILLIVLSLLWVFYSFNISGTLSGELSSTKLSVIFEESFWQTMKAFAYDNYTLPGMIIFLLGIFTFLNLYFKRYRKNKKIGYSFMFYYLVGAILWFIYASYKLQGHNYHQYPLMPLISFMIAYFLIFLSVNISNIFKTKKLKVIIILLALILLISPMTESKNRMYDTQFVGLDIAGDYIKENKLEGERVMHSSHQAYGLLWHGNIKGTRGIPDSVEKMENARVNLSANWLFIYSWDLQILSEPDERSSYIRENYEVKQIAFNVDQNGQLMPVYLLLKYGGPFSENDINEAIKEGPVLTKPYEFSFGTRDLNYVNV